MGLLTCRFFSVNTYSTVNLFSLPYDFLNIFSQAYFIVIIQYVIGTTYKYVNQLSVLLARHWSIVGY